MSSTVNVEKEIGWIVDVLVQLRKKTSRGTYTHSRVILKKKADSEIRIKVFEVRLVRFPSEIYLELFPYRWITFCRAIFCTVNEVCTTATEISSRCPLGYAAYIAGDYEPIRESTCSPHIWAKLATDPQSFLHAFAGGRLKAWWCCTDWLVSVCQKGFVRNSRQVAIS